MGYYYDDPETGAVRWVPTPAPTVQQPAPAAVAPPTTAAPVASVVQRPVTAGLPALSQSSQMAAPAPAPLTQRPADMQMYPSWDSGYTAEDARLNREAQARWDAQYPTLLAEHLKGDAGMSAWDTANRADLASRGQYRPELQRLPSGHLVETPDSGGEVAAPMRASDGRIYKPYMSDDGGEVSRGSAMTGYELAEPKPKTPEEMGLKLTPEQAAQVKGKRFFRYEKFDPSGKSLGYGYRPEDTRGFLKSVVQDLGPMIAMALPFTGIPAMVTSGISSLTGLTGLPAQAASSGLIRGGLSAAGGGDFLKGAVQGAVGATANPLVGSAVSNLGIDNPMVNNALTGAGTSGIKALVGGGDPLQSALFGALSGGAKDLDVPGLETGIKLLPSLIQGGGRLNPVQLALALAQANK